MELQSAGSEQRILRGIIKAFSDIVEKAENFFQIGIKLDDESWHNYVDKSEELIINVITNQFKINDEIELTEIQRGKFWNVKKIVKLNTNNSVQKKPMDLKLSLEQQASIDAYALAADYLLAKSIEVVKKKLPSLKETDESFHTVVNSVFIYLTKTARL